MTVDTSRRRFLHTLAVSSVVQPMLAGRPAAAQSDPTESFWQEVRRQFAFREERVPMNAANLCPSPRAVAERVRELTRDIDVDCSFPNREKFGALLEASREAVAVRLGVTADEIALVRNTSEANNVVNAGLPLGAGDEVVVWDQNHPTNNVAWDVRAARYGLAVTRVATPAAPAGVDELVAAFERALTPRTRVLALTHVSNVTGVRLPVRELARAMAAAGGGCTARGLSMSATARSRRSWPAGWRRGSRQTDTSDAGAEAGGSGVPSPRERSPVAVLAGALDAGLPGGQMRSVRVGADDVVSDGAGCALCGFGSGCWRMNGKPLGWRRPEEAARPGRWQGERKQ